MRIFFFRDSENAKRIHRDKLLSLNRVCNLKHYNFQTQYLFQKLWKERRSEIYTRMIFTETMQSLETLLLFLLLILVLIMA